MGGYIGKLQIGTDPNSQVAFGDILYGTCRTAADTAAKTIVNDTTYTDFPSGFDRLMNGIQVRVKFVNGNTLSSGVTLQILSTTALNVQGDCRCGANEIVCFTFEENPGATSYWRVTSGGVSASVQDYISSQIGSIGAAVDSMIFKGVLSDPANVPNGSSGHEYLTGWTYKINAAGTYAGQVCEVGDLLIAIANSTSGQSTVNNAHWTVAQTNIDGAVTGPASDLNLGNHVAIFDGTTGRVIKDSGFTIGKSVPSDAVFTDTDTNTAYEYTLTNGTTAALTACDALGTNDTGGTVLATVDNGVLKLEKGIKFTTTTYSLSPNAVAGPSLT